jgi:hypothetical protein
MRVAPVCWMRPVRCIACSRAVCIAFRPEPVATRLHLKSEGRQLDVVEILANQPVTG